MKDNLKNEILELVKSADIVKPARYLGGEINAIIKTNADFKFIMSFADLYEVAISNLGLSILYEVINSIEYASCERVYAVAYDFEKLLREKNIPLYTLSLSSISIAILHTPKTGSGAGRTTTSIPASIKIFSALIKSLGVCK